MSDRHDRFVGQNAALSRAYELDHKEKVKDKIAQGGAQKVGKCDQCGKESPLVGYRNSQTDRTEGAASFGFVVKYLCENCKPLPKESKNSLNPKAIKSMLKGAKRNLR